MFEEKSNTRALLVWALLLGGCVKHNTFLNCGTKYL